MTMSILINIIKLSQNGHGPVCMYLNLKQQLIYFFSLTKMEVQMGGSNVKWLHSVTLMPFQLFRRGFLMPHDIRCRLGCWDLTHQPLRPDNPLFKKQLLASIQLVQTEKNKCMKQIYVYTINIFQVSDKGCFYVTKKGTHLPPLAHSASTNCSVSKLLLTSKTDDYSATDGESQQKEGGSWEYRQLANVFTVTKEGESSIWSLHCIILHYIDV